MGTIFLNALKISALSAAGILVILAVSPLFGKTRTVFWRYFLWIALALRLIFPFDLSIPNQAFVLSFPDGKTEEDKNFSLENRKDEFVSGGTSGWSGEAETKSFQTGNLKQKDLQTDSFLEMEKERSGKETADLALWFASVLWAAGTVTFFSWRIVCYGVFCRQMKKTQFFFVEKGLSVYLSKEVSSPVLMGILKPKILLPAREYETEQLEFILKHELTHYRRKDIWVKFLLSLARAVHWFNPIVALMERQAEKDMELLCDSHVVKNFTKEEKKRYSEMLLLCAAAKGKRNVFLCTSEFSRDAEALKKRFANIFSDKRRKKGVLAAAFGICILLSVSFFVTFGSRGISDSENLKTGSKSAESENQMKKDAADLKEMQKKLNGLSVKDAAKAIYGSIFPQLIYASEERAVIYDYWGLLVYDIRNQKIEQLLDLKAAGFASIQGDQTTHIEVSGDGKQILMYNEPDASEKFIYDIEKRSLSWSELTSFGEDGFDGLFQNGEKNYVVTESGKTAYLSEDALRTKDYEIFHETDMQGLSLLVGKNGRGDTHIYPLFLEYSKEQEEQGIPWLNWEKMRRLVGREFLHEDEEGWLYYLEEDVTGEQADGEISWPFEALILTRQRGEERQILETLIFQDTWKECPVLFAGGRIIYKAARTAGMNDLKAPVLVSIAMDGSDRRTADEIMYHVFDGLCEDEGWIYYSGWTDSASQKPLCRISPDFSGDPQFLQNIPGLLCGVKDGFVFYLAGEEKMPGIWKRNLATGEEELADKWGVSAEEISFFNAREEGESGCHIIFQYGYEDGMSTADVRF